MDETKLKFDSIAVNYRSEVEKGMVLDGSDHAYFNEYKLQYIRPYIKEDTKVLDYGCGVGLFDELLDRDFDIDIHGFDISSESIDKISPTLYHGNNLFTYNLKDLDRDYDVAMLVTVLHHVAPDDRTKVMNNIFTRLKCGGVIIVIEHNLRNPFTRKSVEHCSFDEGAVMLKPNETVSLLRTCGFSCVKYKYITFWPKQLSFMRWSDCLLIKFFLGAQYMAVGLKK